MHIKLSFWSDLKTLQIVMEQGHLQYPSVLHSEVSDHKGFTLLFLLYEDCPSVAARRSSDIQQSTCFA